MVWRQLCLPFSRKLGSPLHDIGPCFDQRCHDGVHAAPTSPRQRGVPGFVHVVGVRALVQQPVHRGDLVAGGRATVVSERRRNRWRGGGAASLVILRANGKVNRIWAYSGVCVERSPCKNSHEVIPSGDQPPVAKMDCGATGLAKAHARRGIFTHGRMRISWRVIPHTTPKHEVQSVEIRQSRTCLLSAGSPPFALSESLKAHEHERGVRPRAFVTSGLPPARLSILSSSTLPNLSPPAHQSNRPSGSIKREVREKSGRRWKAR